MVKAGDEEQNPLSRLSVDSPGLRRIVGLYYAHIKWNKKNSYKMTKNKL